MTNIIWTKTVCARLKALWDRKHTATEIAETLSREFGVYFSRNGVVGKSRRLECAPRASPIKRVARDGLPGKARKRSPPKPKPQVTIEAVKPAPAAAQGRFGVTAPKVSRALPREAPAVSEPVPLEVAQERNGCRWPFGHRPTMTFCGKDRHNPLRPYCEEHEARAQGSHNGPFVLRPAGGSAKLLNARILDGD